jgi:hypothetical protein
VAIESLREAEAQARELAAERDQAREELSRLRVDGPATEALAEVRRILGAAKGEGAACAAHRVMGTGSTIPAPAIKVGDRVVLGEWTGPARGGATRFMPWMRPLVGTVAIVDALVPGEDLIRCGQWHWAASACKPAPAEAAPAIKVGDRVRVLEGALWSRTAEGKMGKVEAIDDNDRERYRVIFDDLIELQGGPETNSAWVRRVELLPAQPALGQLMRCVTPDAHAGTYAAPAGFVGKVTAILDGNYKLQGKDAKARWAATIEPVGKARVGDRVRITEAFQSIEPRNFWDRTVGLEGTVQDVLEGYNVHLPNGWITPVGECWTAATAKRVEVLPS